MKNLTVQLTPSEAEALILFLAQQQGLWLAHGREFGLDDPADLERKVIAAHAAAVRQSVAPPEPLRHRTWREMAKAAE